MELDWNFEYGALGQDENFVNACESLKENLIKFDTVLDQMLPLKEHYDKMSLSCQIEYDLFMAFSLTSLQWINLRVQGVDMSNHRLKFELERIKATMIRWKEVCDRSKRPTVNVEAAKRFVRSGLYDPSQLAIQPQNKKIKFEDSE